MLIRRFRYLVLAIAAVGLIAAGCASEDEEASTDGGDSGGDQVTACQVTDTGGVDDKSFNQTANAGLVRAEEELDVKGSVLESKSEADYEPNIQTFIDQGCDLIIPVGFLLDSATQAAAKANPDQKFAIVDVDFFDTDSGTDVKFPNVEEMTFATDQAAFLAGYAAAGTSKSGKVGTFGGLQIPTVTIFMDGFLAGVQQYNKDFSKNVEVLGWNGTTGLFTGDFEDQDKGKSTTKSLIDEGADIIMPVAGPVGQGTIAQVKEADNPDLGVIWVDVDGCTSLPDDCQYFLTTVEKKMDNAVFNSIESVTKDTFTAGVVQGTLENEGVDIAGFNEFDSKVPQELKDKIEEYRQKIIDGSQPVTPAGA
jgi:basic membrane protein A